MDDHDDVDLGGDDEAAVRMSVLQLCVCGVQFWPTSARASHAKLCRSLNLNSPRRCRQSSNPRCGRAFPDISALVLSSAVSITAEPCASRTSWSGGVFAGIDGERPAGIFDEANRDLRAFRQRQKVGRQEGEVSPVLFFASTLA